MADRHPRVVAMQARESNSEVTADGRAAGKVSLRDLVIKALRHNLQRIIVGEVRGDEIVPSLGVVQQRQRIVPHSAVRDRTF